MDILIFAIMLFFVLYSVVARLWLFGKLRVEYSYMKFENDIINNSEDTILGYKATFYAIGFSHNSKYSISVKSSYIKIEHNINNISWILPLSQITNYHTISIPLLNGIIFWHKKSNVPSPFFVTVRNNMIIYNNILSNIKKS